MNIKKQLEEQGKAPTLGWIDNRKPGCGVNLRSTDIRATWSAALNFEDEEWFRNWLNQPQDRSAA
jgi:hypothetical protein